MWTDPNVFRRRLFASLTESSWTDGPNRTNDVLSPPWDYQSSSNSIHSHNTLAKQPCRMYYMYYTTLQVLHIRVLLDSSTTDNGHRWQNCSSLFSYNSKTTWLHVMCNLKRNHMSKANSWLWSINTLKRSRGTWCCNFLKKFLRKGLDPWNNAKSLEGNNLEQP